VLEAKSCPLVQKRAATRGELAIVRDGIFHIRRVGVYDTPSST
jgi:hypothetical protein